MNAIELSEWLIAFTQDASDYEEKWIKDSAEILISQQSQIKEKDVCLKLLGAEIEALRFGIEAAKAWSEIKFKAQEK